MSNKKNKPIAPLTSKKGVVKKEGKHQKNETLLQKPGAKMDNKPFKRDSSLYEE